MVNPFEPLLRPFDRLRASGVNESASSRRSCGAMADRRGACAPKPWRRSKLVEPFQRIHLFGKKFSNKLRERDDKKRIAFFASDRSFGRMPLFYNLRPTRGHEILSSF